MRVLSANQVSRGGNGQMYRRADGTLFLGSAYVTEQSADDGKTWTEIDHSPAACGLVGDGTTMYGVVQFGGASPLYSAPENDPTKWTVMKTPDWSADGGNNLALDRDHHILYAGTQRSGLWRMVLQ